MDHLTLKLVNARELLLLRGKFLFNNYVRDIYFTVDDVNDLFILLLDMSLPPHIAYVDNMIDRWGIGFIVFKEIQIRSVQDQMKFTSMVDADSNPFLTLHVPIHKSSAHIVGRHTRLMRCH